MKFNVINGRAIDSSARPIQTVEPYRTQTVHADVVVPFYQSLIGASLVAAIITVAAWLFWNPAPNILVGIFALSFTVVSTCLWFANLGFSRSTIVVKKIENWTGLDIDGDGYSGTHPLRVNKPRTVDDEVVGFKDFVLHCYEAGTTFAALRQWYSDPEIARYAGWALEHGLGRAKGKTNKSGWELALNEAEALKLIDELEWVERT